MPINLRTTILGLALALLAAASVRAQTAPSPDAIAIRVMPNPERMSALEWYRANRFKGSPQALMVDGYRAVRDGRTVYVNAANIDDRGTASPLDDELHANIYLISYNQEADAPTVDIFTRVLKNWRFNLNKDEPDVCEKETAKPCHIDADCGQGDFCQSDKAKIVRDVRRLEDLYDIRLLLERYRADNLRYPALESGSYIKRRTLSVWPSWQNLFAQYLKKTLPVDPVNALAPCAANFHPVTCWDEAAKAFDDVNISDQDLNLREGSRVYKYYCHESAERYDLCAVMESGYVTDAAAGACSGSASVNVQGATGNLAPEFTGVNVPTALSGEPYEAFISARDPEGDPLTWQYSPPGTWSGWSGPLAMQATPDPAQRKFFAATAGNPGTYSFTVTVSDSLGPLVTRTFTITTVRRRPPVIQAVTDRTVPVGQSLAFTILASEPDSEYPLSFTFSGAPNGFNSAGSLNANNHDWNAAGAVVDVTKPYDVQVIAVDSAGSASSPRNFRINVTNSPPTIGPPPAGNVIACVTNYNYPLNVVDPDGHSVTVTVSGLPAGLVFNPTSNTISGVVTAPPGTYTLNIRARDQYHSYTIAPHQAEAVRTVALNVVAESFSVGVPASQAFYVYPNPFLPYSPVLYRSPVAPRTYNATKTTASPVNWSVTTSPSPLAYDATVAINNTGQISAGAYHNANFPPAGYTFAVNVRATTIGCGVSANASFNLTIRPNEWCGDTQTQSAFGEQCDDGRNGNSYDLCRDNCQFTRCGDGFVQGPNGQGVNESCDDGNTVSGDGCSATCISEFCGDGYKNVSEACEGADLGGATCASLGFVGGTLSCNSDCTINTSACYNDYCGDLVRNGSEDCDGNDFGPSNCASQGFITGTLLCNANCTINTANCLGCCQFDTSNFSNCVFCN